MGVGLQAHIDSLEAGSCRKEWGKVVRAAAAFVEEGKPERAEALLSEALDRSPDHPQLLEASAELHLRQGRLAEAEAVATHLTRIRPESDYGWELLAASRYLQDDPHGALRAWERSRPPVVRDIEIRILGHSGSRAPGSGADPVRMTGIRADRPLTVEGLVRGERRLVALPAAARVRVGYQALSGGEAAIQGTVVLRAKHPFAGSELVAHALRLLSGRVDIVTADPLGRFERWELSGTVEGTLRRAGLVLAHPALLGFGVWRWEVDHEVGRYGSTLLGEAAREARTGIGWSHTDWVAGVLRGTIHGRLDLRPGRGTFAGAGMGWTLLSLSARSSVGAKATGWTGIGQEAAEREGPGNESRFGRMEIRASLLPSPSPSFGAAPSGVGARLGVVAVSSGLPPDLMPRIGAGGTTSLLMRARSDLDGEGVVRPLFPGTAWAHGGIELVRPVGSVGPVGIGIAAFADGVGVLLPDRRLSDPAARKAAVHLGAGVRARIAGVDGFLRVDGGIDPSDGASTLSMAWVQEHPLNGLLAH